MKSKTASHRVCRADAVQLPGSGETEAGKVMVSCGDPARGWALQRCLSWNPGDPLVPPAAWLLSEPLGPVRDPISEPLEPAEGPQGLC